MRPRLVRAQNKPKQNEPVRQNKPKRQNKAKQHDAKAAREGACKTKPTEKFE